jgi:MOSC domain-containing protein YiiM
MTIQSGKVLSINIAQESKAQSWTDSGNRTGIHKIGVEGLIQFGNDGLVGDNVVDRVNHGGYHKAVYAYAREDAEWWEKKIGREIEAGQFGENVTTAGIDVTGAVIGERWQIGDLLLEVSEPRIPCRIFSGFWERPTLIKEFTAANRPGAYLRIIDEAMIERGATIEVVHRPTHGITIGDIFAAKSGERAKISEIAQVKELSAEYQEWAKRVGVR